MSIEHYISDPSISDLYTISEGYVFKSEVRRIFTELFKLRGNDTLHRGCLLVNSIAELSSSRGNAELTMYLQSVVSKSKLVLIERILTA